VAYRRLTHPGLSTVPLTVRPNDRWQEATDPFPSTRPVLSAVVFAYRNENTILRSVSSLVQQDFDEPFEVIVATSGGDRTGELVRQSFPSVRVIESPVRMMPGGARNLGMKLARGEIIAFLEADCIARQGWIKNRVIVHRVGHEAVASAVAVANPHRSAARATAYLCCENRLERSPAGVAELPRSYGLSFTRELLNRAGPFDQDRRIEEDDLMAGRLLELGVSPWFDPSVCIEHVGPTHLIDLLKEQASRGRRQARSDILTRSAGRFRLKMESKTGLLTLALTMRTVRHGLVRSRFLSKNLLRWGPDRHELVVTLPWILLGLIANTLGWGQEQYTYAYKGAFTEWDGAGPSLARLRRQITTTGEKILALTFDDGPSDFTPDVVRVLSSYDVPATFFVLGERTASMPEIVRSIAEAGHGVGIHGWTHTAFTELDPGVLDADLSRTSDLLQNLTGSEYRNIRPPYGRYDGELVSALADRQLATWLWTADAGDWSVDASAAQIAKKALRSLTPGGIVLLHDGGGNCSATIRALPRIIEGALARGFRFVTLDEVPAIPRSWPA
jgi:peptidoglycan/xylan/chitin deacetylase (PgdA/CDA1 family)/glycosyltransferase involved in cell wall biosynthesis